MKTTNQHQQRGVKLTGLADLLASGGATPAVRRALRESVLAVAEASSHPAVQEKAQEILDRLLPSPSSFSRRRSEAAPLVRAADVLDDIFGTDEADATPGKPRRVIFRTRNGEIREL